MIDPPAPIPADTRDWTLVIAQGCRECGFMPQPPQVASSWLAGCAQAWAQRLQQPDSRSRPTPTTWSPLEYGAHVRDLSQVFRKRVVRTLTVDNPVLESWDQDQAAVEGNYFRQVPAQVGEQCARAVKDLALTLESVRADQWSRTASRADGWQFTLAELVNYYLHDVIHHLSDVGITFDSPAIDAGLPPEPSR
ncbi:MAG TPA: DinB family protein [Marmoricola sp.]|nr:DinB family protein [Marmoricola sp.]